MYLSPSGFLILTCVRTSRRAWLETPYRPPGYLPRDNTPTSEVSNTGLGALC